MKKYISTFLISLSSLIFGCTPPQHNKHIGTWEADVGEEHVLVWEINKNTLISSFTGEPETNNYTINYSKDPIWFDSSLSGNKIHAIMKFINKDSFMIVGTENDEPRPERFEGTDDLLTFKRVNK